jgi:hypothetical protein
MTKQAFAPKDAKTLKAEVISDLGIDYEGNEDIVDKLVNRELKSEEFKSSLHEDKVKHLEGKEFYKNKLIEAGFDPKTGEKVNKPNGDKGETKQKEEYSLQDIRALQDVHDDDVEDISKFAKFEKISIAEAKKHPIISILLKEKEEQRKTAEAANVNSGRRGTSKPSFNKILEDVSNGIVPENPEDLANARFEERKAKRA